MSMTFFQRWSKRWLLVRKSRLFCTYSRVWMRLYGCTVPSSCRIFATPHMMRMEGRAILGERVMLNSLGYLYRLGQEFRMVLATGKHGVIEIGDDCGFNGTAIYAEKSVKIGKRVMIGGGSRIMDIDCHPVDAIPRRYAAETNPARPIVIEDDAWLGAEVFVMPGVTIGKGSVIAARSVVTKDIPPMVVAAGIPAKVVRELGKGEDVLVMNEA